MTEKQRIGLTQIYTGTGKGKTTATLGLAFRASGQGLKVIFIQFVKGRGACGEHLAAQKSGLFEIVHLNTEDHFKQQEGAVEQTVQQTLKLAKDTIRNGCYDMVILDEIFIALKLKQITEEQVLEFIRSKPPQVELVLSGRYAPASIMELADLVSEIKPLKHPKDKGVAARCGIEF